MARTNAADVNEILDTSLDNTSIDAWIDIASEIVDDVQDADSTISATRLQQLEKLLTAHLASSQDQRAESLSSSSRSVSYQGDTGMGINGTKYGQQAIGLDPTGVLSGFGKPKASISTPDIKDFDT